MKFYFAALILSLLPQEFNKISEINTLKEKAEVAYKSNLFKEASIFYEKLSTQYGIQDERLKMNLAHSYFKIQERSKAEKLYLELSHSEYKPIKAISFQQLGLIKALKGKNQQALQFFIQCLKIDPLNETARYNFELIKKLDELQLEEEKDYSRSKSSHKEKGNQKGSNEKGENQKDKNIKSSNTDGIKKGNKGDLEESGDWREEGENGKERESKEFSPNGEDSQDKKTDQQGNKSKEGLKARRLIQVNMSEEKARMILEAMKNEELQYLQQVRKNIVNKNYKNKPDW